MITIFFETMYHPILTVINPGTLPYKRAIFGRARAFRKVIYYDRYPMIMLLMPVLSKYLFTTRVMNLKLINSLRSKGDGKQKRMVRHALIENNILRYL